MIGRLLIVDDEPAFLRLAARALETAGHRVETAADRDAGAARFAAGGIDLVVLDLAMPPDMDAEAGLGHIARFPGVPVIVLTGHAAHALALQAVDAGAWDFLGKPIEPELLDFAVRRALERTALLRELAGLRRRVARDATGLVGDSPAMQALRDLIARIAPTDVPVLVLGPSGSGKEVAARALHALSRRADGPFVPINCSAIPAHLLESELFGHLKGSFTGADRDRAGLVATAAGGTLFLDEIGDMAVEMQAKLLRFLEDGRFLPVGGRTPLYADIRVVAATNADLDARIAAGRFREDLYYRLRGMALTMPPLADRPEDIPALARHLLARACPDRPPALAPEALAWLAARPWPGNIRELRAVVTTAAALAPPRGDGRGDITVADLRLAAGGADGPAGPGGPDSLAGQVAAFERRLIHAALDACGHNLTHAAARLGLSRMGLLNKMDRYGLPRPRSRPAHPDEMR
ncbi:MAG: sigma-54-dependent Fis family transcriptional regulator [Rhodospirillaceae bacterium]|nr:sigma-54-dependent Fis family transcriptional regulator [Rhodospirillaceae bacterium]